MNGAGAIFHRTKKMIEDSTLLPIVLGVDVVLVALHIFHQTHVLSSGVWNVLGLWRNIEIYQILKLFLIVILFASIVKSTKNFGYVSWGLLFTYLLLDEAFVVHQRFGDFIASTLSLSVLRYYSLPPRLYEVTVFALVLAALSAIVARTYFSGSGEFKEISKDLCLLILLWAFFGFFTDLTALVGIGPGIEFASDFVEDGGELVLVSMIMWYVFLLARRKGKPGRILHHLLRKPLTTSKPPPNYPVRR